MRYGLIDSHCHLDLEPLKSGLAIFLQEAAESGVCGVVIPGVHPNDWDGIAAVAAANPGVFAAYGVHPMNAECVNDTVLERLLELTPDAVAIGEIGLDPTCRVPLELQESVFRRQLRIAVGCGLPVLIHCRSVFQRVLQILRDEHAEQIGGIMHAFSGSVEMAHEFIRLGFVVSVSGTVTWKNAVKPLRVAGELPLEHLVLETDAPDMTPQRYRGAFNRPAWLTETAVRMAELRNIPVEEVARVTTSNARRVLRLGNCSA